MGWTTLLFSFRGRINRAEYWQAVRTCFYLTLAGYPLALFIASLTVAFGILGGAWVAGMIVCLVALGLSAAGIKRLHDQEKSGWWILILWSGPIVLTGSYLTPSSLSIILYPISVGAVIVTIGAIIGYGSSPGTPGPNRYGPAPEGASSLSAG
jgi:uncharacterized membrane protein YhaH (DUF805 family)